MTQPSVVVLGGGLAGMAASYALARAGWSDLTIVERSDEVGGLAGSFEQGGRVYPLAYHHISHLDRNLLFFLDLVGALDSVRWRRIRLLMHLDGRFHDLADPAGFLGYPMSLLDKARFLRLILSSYAKADWSDWESRSAAELVDRWGSPGVRVAVFEPLSRLKFNLPCSEIDAAWLGARLNSREGSAPLGYIPAANWTKVLSDGIAGLLGRHGVKIRLGRAARRLEGSSGRIERVEMEDGGEIRSDLVVCALPTTVYSGLSPGDATEGLRSIRYTSVISAVCATRRPIRPEFYWLNLATLDTRACGLFNLSSLNPSIGAPGETTLNFVTHVIERDASIWSLGDDRLRADYLEDFRRIFGAALEPEWVRLSRLPIYSPVFVRGYRNPPVRSTTYGNVFFAGNYRTFPSSASTGTAIGSGIEAARAILEEHGQGTDLPEAVSRFRLRAKPRE